MQLKKLKKKDDTLNNKLIDEIITDSVYQKMKSKIEGEINEVLIELENAKNKISNLEDFVNKSISICQNINEYWASGDYKTRVMIQDLVFPQGVVLDAEKRQYLTKNKNVIFTCIEEIAKETEGQKKGQIRNKSDLSGLVAGAGFEPTTFGL